jgi:hypothetical protein
MLDPTPLAPIDQTQVVQTFVQRITERTIEIAIKNKPIAGRGTRHSDTLPEWFDGVYPTAKKKEGTPD